MGPRSELLFYARNFVFWRPYGNDCLIPPNLSVNNEDIFEKLVNIAPTSSYFFHPKSVLMIP